MFLHNIVNFCNNFYYFNHLPLKFFKNLPITKHVRLYFNSMKGAFIMGFIYNKPLSIEQIFSMFNINGGDKIDKEEAANAKNISIFNGFIVEENMTLETFEEKNLETYKKYEELNTKAYAEQYKDSDIKQWKENAIKTLEELKKKELEELEAQEKELMEQKELVEQKLMEQKEK